MILDQPPARHPYSKRKVVLLSGLSDPASCALSDVQRRFLATLPADDDEKVLANFPYLPAEDVCRQSPSLLRASWANGWQFWQAGGPRYRMAATRHWNALAESCESLTVITLSCGLEILNSCLVGGVRPAALRVISLGPVAMSRPPASHTLIQGSRDFISKPFFRRTEITLPGVGHLNYLKRTETVAVLNELLEQSA